MKLREHPKMRWQGQPIWPPMFGGNYSGLERFPQDEQGILRDVIVSPSYVATESLTLVTEFEGHTFSAELFFDDLRFLNTIYPSVRACIGQPVHCVGDVEVEFES